MLGHAVCDALGVPVEFADRERLDRDPVTNMRGFGTYAFPAGTWSDDTSMSLAALDVIMRGEVDFDAIMKNFALWLDKDEFTAAGETFDVGRGCFDAIRLYLIDGKKATLCGGKGEYNNGNGSLMRINPFVLYAYAKDMDFSSWGGLIRDASALTHAHERSIVGCLIYSFVLLELLKEGSKESLLRGLKLAQKNLCDSADFSFYERIFADDFKLLSRDEIKSSGYVVDSLEAALWCLLTTNNFRDCALRAVNLGGDTDTVAAIAGGLAGALYGYSQIPVEWLSVIKRRDYIEEMCITAAKNLR